MIEFLRETFLPQFAILTSITLIIYIALELLLGGEKRKVGKDVTLLLSISLGFLVMLSISITNVLENIIQYVSTILVIIFMGALVFGGWIGYEGIKKGFEWTPLKGLILFVIAFGIILIVATKLIGKAQKVPTTEENVSRNVTTSETGRELTYYERIIFDPKLLFTVLFLLLFAAVALIIGR